MTSETINGEHAVVCEKCGCFGPGARSAEAACMAALDANWDYYSASSPRRLRFGEGRRLLELPRSDLRLVCGDCRRLMVHQPEESLVLDAFSVERISTAAIHESSQEFRKLAIAILVGSCTAEQFPELHAAREQLEERATE